MRRPQGVRSWLSHIAVALAATMALVLGAPAAPALASHTCVGTSCTGKNPHTTNCASHGTTTAAAIWRSPIDGGSHTSLRLVDSSSCKARWARLQADHPYYWAGLTVQFKIERWQYKHTVGGSYWDLTHTYTRSVTGPVGGYWTSMAHNTMGSSDRHRACWRVIGGTGWQCTSFAT
jgi:hypothetical protein